VAIEIQGMDAGPVGSGTTPAVEPARHGKPVPSGTTPGTPTPPADHVKITDAARLLAALQDAVATAPDMDMKRVEHLRLSIARGHYVPNPAQIADRIMQLETDIAAATGQTKA
jgi:flagellar biosynthesis anti-sigma factor FlgM